MLSLGKKIDSFKKKCFFYWNWPLLGHFISNGPQGARRECTQVVRTNQRREWDFCAWHGACESRRGELFRRPIRAPRMTCVQKEKMKLITETTTCSSRFTAINWAKREMKRGSWYFLREDWSPALLPVSSTSWSDLELKTTTISLVRWHQVSTSSPKSGCGKSPDLDAVRRTEVIERGS